MGATTTTPHPPPPPPPPLSPPPLSPSVAILDQAILAQGGGSRRPVRVAQAQPPASCTGARPGSSLAVLFVVRPPMTRDGPLLSSQESRATASAMDDMPTFRFSGDRRWPGQRWRC
eukprot:1409391-Pyramimonas_sp.AAC.1